MPVIPSAVLGMENMHMSKKVKLRLIVDVEYDSEGVPARVLRDMLEYIPQMASSNGMMSGDTEATVDTWSMRTVEVLDPPENLNEWLEEAVEDGVITLDTDAVVRYGLKEPAELIHEWYERMAIQAAHYVGDELSMAPGAVEALKPKIRWAFKEHMPAAQLDAILEGGAEQMALLLCESRRGDLLNGVLENETLNDLESRYPGYRIAPSTADGDSGQ